MDEPFNFNRQPYVVPPVCQDLADVLPLPGKAWFPPEGLPHIERHVLRLLEAPIGKLSLWIGTAGQSSLLWLMRRHEPVHAVIIFDVERE